MLEGRSGDLHVIHSVQATQEQYSHSRPPSRPQVLYAAGLLCGFRGVVGSRETCCVCLDTPGYSWILVYCITAFKTEISASVGCCCANGAAVLLRYLHGLHHAFIHSGRLIKELDKLAIIQPRSSLVTHHH